MTNLQCSVMSCANNAQGCCCLPGIQVSGDHACDCGDTCCSSFQTKSSAMQNAVQYNQPNQTLEISCSAGTCNITTTAAARPIKYKWMATTLASATRQSAAPSSANKQK